MLAFKKKKKKLPIKARESFKLEIKFKIREKLGLYCDCITYLIR